MKWFNKLFTSLMIFIAASAAYGQSTTQGGVRIDGAHTAGNIVVFGDSGRSLVDVGATYAEYSNTVDLAAGAVPRGASITNLTGYGSAALVGTNAFATAAQGALATSSVQPHTDGNLELTATTNITLSAANEVNITAAEGDINLAAVGSSSDLFLTTIDGMAMIAAIGNGGVSVRSVNNSVDITAYNGNVVIDGSNGVYLASGGVEKALFSATTNYFSVPITVGNATNAAQALNQTVADGLYADIAIEDLAANSVQPGDSITNLAGYGSAALLETNAFVQLEGSGAGEVFYADGLGGGVWDAAQSPTSGISQAVADVLYPRKTDLGSAAFEDVGIDGTFNGLTYSNGIVVAINPYYQASGEMWYGVEWYTTDSSPDLTRIGNYYMHRSLPIQSQVYACALQDDGTESYIYNPTNWNFTTSGAAAKLDGTDGQVMIHFPEYWREDVAAGTYRSMKISPVEQAGWEYVPEQYVGAFEAVCYRADGVTTNLASVVNTNTTYRGGNNNASLDGTDATFIGRPASYLIRTTLRTYARARGTGWEMYNYDAHRTLTTLFVIEYATRNTQKGVISTLDANGFKQGGLGNGVTTVSTAAWTAFNNLYPFVPCGTASSVATGTGEVAYTLPTAFSNTVSSVNVPVYRGIENPFGHVYKSVDGMNLQVYANGEVDPSSYVWISSNPSDWNDSNYTGYTNIGKTIRANGYTVTMILGHTITASSAGGSSLTYYCDRVLISPPPSGVTLRIALLGGQADSKESAGFYTAHLNSPPPTPSTFASTRLCYFPQPQP